MNFLRRLALQEKKLYDSSRLDVIEIARVPDMLPSLFPSWSRLRTYQQYIREDHRETISVTEYDESRDNFPLKCQLA